MLLFIPQKNHEKHTDLWIGKLRHKNVRKCVQNHTDSWDSCRGTGQAYSMDHNYIIIYYE